MKNANVSTSSVEITTLICASVLKSHFGSHWITRTKRKLRPMLDEPVWLHLM